MMSILQINLKLICSHTDVTKLQLKESVCPFPTKMIEMSTTNAAHLRILLRANFLFAKGPDFSQSQSHFLLGLGASFYISHKVAAFLQKYSCQQLKLEESDNSTRNRNQGTDTKQVKMKSSKMAMVPKQNKGFQTQSLLSNVIASSLSAA